jgi:hypothetical protein
MGQRYPLHAYCPIIPVLPGKNDILKFHCLTFQTSFQSATFTRHSMPTGVAQGGLVFPVLFSLYVNNMPTLSRHVKLALYVDDTALVATSHPPLLLVSCLETSFGRHDHLLWDRNIAMNVSNCTSMLFAKT